MANLATAKKGEVVVLKSGKRIESDGRGGGRVSRPKPGKTPPKKKVKPNGKPTKNTTPVATGLRKLGKRGDTLTDLIKQGKGR